MISTHGWMIISVGGVCWMCDEGNGTGKAVALVMVLIGVTIGALT